LLSSCSIKIQSDICVNTGQKADIQDNAVSE
jgi:hypothetical protein